MIEIEFLKTVLLESTPTTLDNKNPPLKVKLSLYLLSAIFLIYSPSFVAFTLTLYRFSSVNTTISCFLRNMKRECIHRKSFRNQAELRLCCFEYINRYNTKRPHSSLGNYTPDEIKTFYMERQE